MDNIILIFAIILLTFILIFSILRHKYTKMDKENMGRFHNFLLKCSKFAKVISKKMAKDMLQEQVDESLSKTSKSAGKSVTKSVDVGI